MGKKEKLKFIAKILQKEFDKYYWNKESFIVRIKNNFISVIFNKVSFRFYYNKNYESLSCDITKDNDYYSLGELGDNKVIVFDEIIYDDQADVCIKEYVKQYVKIINKCLIDTIMGDLSIFNRIKTIRENIYIIQKEMDEDLIFDTKAYKKMINGDIDWKSKISPR